MAVFELCLRHVDRAPMLWDHNGREVTIDIASRRDEHLSAGVADRQVIGEKELLLLSLLCCRPQMQHGFRILRQRKRGCRD